MKTDADATRLAQAYTTTRDPKGFLGGHIKALDGVRGLAVALVFVFHYGGGAQSAILPVRAIGTLVKFGWSGVSLFFVLSGFLISGILWNSYQRYDWWRRFYARRSLRIFPLYSLAILIAILVEASLSGSWQHLRAFWIYILYLRDIPALDKPAESVAGTMYLYHLWSLSVEEQFYVVWPFLLGIFAGQRRNAMRLILSLWTLSFLFRLAVIGLHVNMEWSTVFLLGRAGELLTGAYLALLLRGDDHEADRIYRVVPITFTVSFIVVATVAILSRDPAAATPLMSTVGLAALGIFFGSIIALSLRPGIIQTFFSLAWLRWLGMISYGIYVYHILFQYQYSWIARRLVPHAGKNRQQIVLFLVAMMGTLAIASLSYYTVESFFLRWKNRIGATENLTS